jgi:hypothetical protein
MTDPDTTRRLRPEVEALIRGMHAEPFYDGTFIHEPTIAAVHFDGPLLDQMIDIFVRLNPPHNLYPQYLGK